MRDDFKALFEAALKLSTKMVDVEAQDEVIFGEDHERFLPIDDERVELKIALEEAKKHFLN